MSTKLTHRGLIVEIIAKIYNIKDSDKYPSETTAYIKTIAMKVFTGINTQKIELTAQFENGEPLKILR